MIDVKRPTDPAVPNAATTAAWVALAMLAFAANSIFCRTALRDAAIDPATFTVIRIFSGAVVLWCLCGLRAHRRIGGSWSAASALLAYAACFSFAYLSLTAGTGALLLFGAVQLTMISFGVIAGERFAISQWVGFMGAVAGLLALLAPGVTAPEPAGAVVMLIAGIAWGIYSLLGRSGADPIGATAGNFLRAAALSVPLLLIASRSSVPWDTRGIMWAALSGGLASGLGYAVWYTALPRLPATIAASVQLSVPVITALIGAAVLAEPFTTRLALASAAILFGIGVVIMGRRRSV